MEILSKVQIRSQKPQNKQFFKTAISGFPKEVFFTQKVEKLKFYIIFNKIQKFSQFSTKTYSMLQNHAWTSGMPNFRLIIQFWQNSPQTVSVDDVSFSNCDFEHFQTSNRNKNDIFFNPEIKLIQKQTFFIRKKHFENLTLCGPGLTRPFSVVGLHGIRLQNGLDFF